MKTSSNKRFSRKHDRKVLVAEESTKSWADSDSDTSSSSSSSSDSEQEEVHCFMADQTDEDEVFDFSNVEFTRDDLVIALNDMVKEYRKLSHSFEEAKAANMSLNSSSAESSSDELEDVDILKTKLSKLQAENEMLRNEISELKAEVNKSTVEMSSWNKANLSLQNLYESQKQASDKTGIGFNNSEFCEGEPSTQSRSAYDKFNKMSFVKADMIYNCLESVKYDNQNSPKLNENRKAGVILNHLLLAMAASFYSNAIHVDFDSVLAMDEPGMVLMFQALVASGLQGFLGCSPVVYEEALVEFFANGRVRDGLVVSLVDGAFVEISEELFAETFGLPIDGLGDLSAMPKDAISDARSIVYLSGEPISLSGRKNQMKFEYRLLCDIMAKAISVKAGSFNPITVEKFSLMTAVVCSIRMNWAKFLFSILKKMVSLGSKQAKGFAIQISLLLATFPSLELVAPSVQLSLEQQQSSSSSSSSSSSLHFDKTDVDATASSVPLISQDLSAAFADLQANLSEQIFDYQSGLSSKLHKIEQSVCDSLRDQADIFRNLSQGARQEARTLDDVQSIRFNELRKNVLSQNAYIFQGLADVRQEVQAVNAKVDIMASRLNAIQKDAEATKEALSHQLLEFQSQAQENHNVIHALLSELVDYIHRGSADKKGESGSRGLQQPANVQIEGSAVTPTFEQRVEMAQRRIVHTMLDADRAAERDRERRRKEARSLKRWRKD
ncbi:hypothetical protein F511_37171 [Dorcoceras hygrometricum]|uniref:Dystroglycan-like n=1 Tax=Dorcoceras hygrometricum TaxID=472368 RepID=A0A2Z7D6J3_9LAMI|nr:hypothetical protein F511_37171 [Dorcoceras hygrometricum]